jgi:peptide methionine sulfoxide reductase MsrB
MADFPVTKTDDEWRQILNPEQYQILREHATERPGSCALNTEKRAGTFACAGCGQELFVNDTKFNSGTGWPSFFAPLPGSVGTRCTARSAAGTWGTCLPTARRRLASATASTARY